MPQNIVHSFGPCGLHDLGDTHAKGSHIIWSLRVRDTNDPKDQKVTNILGEAQYIGLQK